MYGGGAVCFTPDGCALLSPVGHRVSAFHLLQQRSSTFPFSLPSPVQHLALSPDGQLLVVVDEAGRALFVHYPSQHVLFEYAFNGPVACLAFAPSRPFLAVAVGATTLILPRPSLLPSYRPLHVHRRMTLHSAPITCMAWSDDGMYLTTGGEDGVAKVATLGDVDDGWEVLTLAGHRGGVVGAWWGGARTAADEQRGEGQQPLPQPQLRVYTVTKDGALLQWRWREAEDAPVQAKVEASTAAARSSHVARPAKAVRGAVRLFGIAGRFTLSSKHFLSTNSGGHVVSACALHRTAHGVDLLLVAFSSGSFSLYELPSFTLIHALSVSSSSLSAVAVSPSGAWLAVASRGAGSLLVWEWQSESYVLRQQGHASAVAALAFSPDGAYTATGGDDGRVKLWHAQRGFCFKTFAHHSAPVSDVAFAPSNNVLFSASADGAVHAYDLVRYRLFRTFTPPTPCQLSCMALDGAGELVMAGSTDPFDVFVFSVQSGRLLDVLSGHSGPISGLAFSSALSLVLSSSWDGSVRLWDPFEGRGCVDVLAHDSDVLCLALSPSGQSVAAALLNGSVSVWDLRSAAVTSFLEAGKDLAGGRARADVRTAKSRGAGHATSLCWSADGACLLVGGDSRWVCIYDVQRRLLLKRFVLSSNERLDGIKDRLNSRAVNDEADEGDQGGVEALPGARTGERSARRFGLAVRSRCVRFAPTGQQWAAATNEGLLTFALDEELTFDPTDLGQCPAPLPPPLLPLRCADERTNSSF